VVMWRHRPRGTTALSNAGQPAHVSARPLPRAVAAEPVLFPVGRGRDAAAAGAIEPRLRPSGGPVVRFLGMTVVALFWNGIVSIFMINLVGEWRTGHWPIFLTLFLTPFVLVGLGLLGSAGYFLLACFNPRPRASLLPEGGVAVGEDATLRWRLTGRATRIARLTVTLEGREEATYVQGTDSKTDTEVFHRATLVTTANPWEVASGEVKVAIPPSTMHSFAAPHNKVRWVITIHGEIPRWPDLKEELGIEVLPAPDRGEAA